MKKVIKYLFGFLALLSFLSYPVPLMAKNDVNERQLMVSAAMSLKDVMTKIGDEFQKEHKNVKVLFNFASSGQLRSQIESGAPVDLFVPASATDMDILIKKDLVLNDTKTILAGNELVLIVNQKSKIDIKSIKDLTNSSVKKIACGNPDTVPAGKYAKETMKYFDLSEALKTKLVFGENVRQVLDYVSRDEVEAGFVFSTDAKIDPQVKVVYRVPSEAHSEITYPLVVLKASLQQQLAKEFIKYATSPTAHAILDQYGFTIIRK